MTLSGDERALYKPTDPNVLWGGRTQKKELSKYSGLEMFLRKTISWVMWAAWEILVKYSSPKYKTPVCQRKKNKGKQQVKMWWKYSLKKREREREEGKEGGRKGGRKEERKMKCATTIYKKLMWATNNTTKTPIDTWTKNMDGILHIDRQEI